tara:strand:+ start:184 stop:546 length:363 start_codon:yes stop_codon:yes gene_type:complete
MTEKEIEGRWWKIENKIEQNISAKYDRIKDWIMDPKGYFLIKVDKENELIRVGYCTPKNEMVAEVTGKTAIEISNTLIREEMISSLQHASDMGIELYKAELALKYNLEYTQDSDLEIKKD